MVHGKNRIPYWIDRRLTGLAGPEYDATISFGLPFESEDCPYGESRLTLVPRPMNRPVECWQPIQSGTQRGLDFMVKHSIKGIIGGGGS